MSWIEEFLKLVFQLSREGLDIEAGFKIKQENIPRKLYKYRSFDEKGRSLKNLAEDKIWIADPLTFNDPYDCHHYINYEALIDDILEKSPDHLKKIFTPSLRESLFTLYASDFAEFQRAGDKVKEGIRLCSFSERVDSTLMWSHYSYNHQGFCIEYDVTQPGVHEWTSRFMFPVIYRDEVFDATELIKIVKDGNLNNLYLNLAALYKASDWSYEREWRLVFANHIMDAPGPWNMPKPTAVYCGSHIFENNLEKIKELCYEREIPIFKMEHDRHIYRMSHKKL